MTKTTKTENVEKLEKAFNKSNVVDTTEALDALIKRVKKAQEIFETYSQEQVDKIFKAAALAANKMRIPLAQMAVEETGMGVVEDKVILLLNISTTNTKTQKHAVSSKKINQTELKLLHNLWVLLPVLFLQQTQHRQQFSNH